MMTEYMRELGIEVAKSKEEWLKSCMRIYSADSPCIAMNDYESEMVASRYAIEPSFQTGMVQFLLREGMAIAVSDSRTKQQEDGAYAAWMGFQYVPSEYENMCQFKIHPKAQRIRDLAAAH